MTTKELTEYAVEVAMLVACVLVFAISVIQILESDDCARQSEYVQEQTRWTVARGCEVKTEEYGWVQMHYFNNRD